MGHRLEPTSVFLQSESWVFKLFVIRRHLFVCSLYTHFVLAQRIAGSVYQSQQIKSMAVKHSIFSVWFQVLVSFQKLCSFGWLTEELSLTCVSSKICWQSMNTAHFGFHIKLNLHKWFYMPRKQSICK